MEKKLKVAIIVGVLILVVVAGVRFLSGEDDWICVDGEWVKHGVPSAEKPEGACEENFVQRIFGVGAKDEK